VHAIDQGSFLGSLVGASLLGVTEIRMVVSKVTHLSWQQDYHMLVT